MINKSVVAKSNEDFYPKSREAMTDKNPSVLGLSSNVYSAAVDS